MQRQIKYRAWIPDLKVMLDDVVFYYPDSKAIGISDDDFKKAIEGKFLINDEYGDILPLDYYDNDEAEKIMTVEPGTDWWWFINENDFELIEFTGLTDEKGSELFTGDICTNEAAKWEVIFNTGCYCAKIIGKDYPDQHMHLALRAIRGLQKLGNKYENPELLYNVINDGSFSKII